MDIVDSLFRKGSRTRKVTARRHPSIQVKSPSRPRRQCRGAMAPKSRHHVNPRKATAASGVIEEEEGEVNATSFASPTQSALLEKSRDLLEMFTLLYMLGFGKELSLPKIVLLGDQSTGKSSVVESLAGVNLPRGEGIVTRVPTVVSMLRDSVEEILVCKKDTEKVKVLQEHLAEKILELQSEIAGEHDVKNEPIHVEVHGASLFNLTIIDLPGLVKVAGKGQDEGIVDRVKKMASFYIAQPETLIVVVIPAVMDIATVEAVRLAREVDPDGLRTIGVITKCDMVQDEDSVVRKLSQELISTGLGAYALKNRTSKQVRENLPFAEAKKNERLFFESTDYAADFPAQVGIESLAGALHDLLKKRIEEFFPSVVEKMEKNISLKQEALNALGLPIPDTLWEKRARIRTVVRHFCDRVRTQLQIGYCGGSVGVDDSEASSCVMTQLGEAFRRFGNSVRTMKTDYGTPQHLAIVRDMLKARRALKLPGFPSYAAFESITTKTLSLFQPLSERLVDESVALVRDVCLGMVHFTGLGAAERALKARFTSEFRQFVDTLKANLVASVRKQMDLELGFIFTNNHYYAQTVDKARRDDDRALVEQSVSLIQVDLDRNLRTTKSLPANALVSSLRSNEDAEAHDIEVMLSAYHKVATKRIMDVIPMLVVQDLVKPLRTDLHRQMEMAMDRDISDDAIMSLVVEERDSAIRRSRLKADIKKYQRGLEVLRGGVL